MITLLKTLLLVQKEQRIILDDLYAAVEKYTDCDLFWLSGEEQGNLKQWFKKHIDIYKYERIILFLRFKKEIRQVKFIRTLPNLVILEHDAYQNYIHCKYHGKFSVHYHKLPWARVLVSGFSVSQKLQKEGLNAVFVPKGYDGNMMENRHQTRDVELGFIGSIKSKTYSQRKELLEGLAEKENLLITRTNSGDDYVNTLNRIRFFISADVGMGEYMIKNFEAMACGCVLFAWNQGDEENHALGFKDMKNIVLYSSMDELLSKLNLLRQNVILAECIAATGQKHAEQHFTFDRAGQKVAEALSPELRKKRVRSCLGFKKYEWVK